MANRIGCQTPTKSVVLPYSKTLGQEAIDLYNKTGRKFQEWQCLLMNGIMAVNDDGLWTHTKVGYAVSRRNGKSEILIDREMWGLKNGEHILHTAHRTTTSHASWEKLVSMLTKTGLKEKQDFKTSKSFGIETITMLKSGAQICFRTRSSKSGLGEGYDLLVIDEAQEYTDDQASALKYVVTDSKNPQTIMCGTPPTPVSAGTVFTKLRTSAIDRETDSTMWAEWAVDEQTDPYNIEAWYRTNPSLGTIFTERSVKDEISGDIVDFNIQRLGLWIKYNLKSAITEVEWKRLQVETAPELQAKKYIGIKFGKDGTNVSMSIAAKCANSNKIFIEGIDCRPTRAGTRWIIDFLQKAKNIEAVIVDGANGQQLLAKDMHDAKLKKPIFPTVTEIITANAMFEQSLYTDEICHCDQPSLTNAVSNCDKRPIGSNGGFGYKALKPDIEIALLDSAILAFWSAHESKETKKQTISY